MQKWVIHTATGEFLHGGPYEPACPSLGVDENGNPIANPDYSIVVVAGEARPDSRTQKWGGNAVVSKTAAEIKAYDLAQVDAAVDLHYKNKDLLGLCTTVLEYVQTPAVWGAKSNATRRQEVVALAKRYQQLRKWVERNYAFMNF